jgi:antitoxin (DNA-binding transcriptional repressor) of toxin-antitoxin stability system
MKTAEAKTHFSSPLKDVEAGNEVAIVYGKKKKALAAMIPYEKLTHIFCCGHSWTHINYQKK